MPKNKYGLYITIFLSLLLVLGAALLLRHQPAGRASFCGNNPQKDDGRMKEDLERLSSESYEGVLLSMHSTENFKEEDFLTYRGLRTAVAAHTLLDTKELSEYLDCVLESGNTLSHIYLCPDPELLWMEAGEKEDKWIQNLDKGLYSYIEANPHITFEILLPYPALAYWLALEEENLETLLTAYHTLVGELSAYPNTMIFFPGFEEWLMVNPDNYTDTLFDANELVTQKLFLYTFCDAAYQITPVNEDFFWESVRATVTRERITPSAYPDLSDWCLVFFGDSVLGNYPGSCSIPGNIAGLSGAATYNYAVGGTCATARPEGSLDFPRNVDRFLAESPSIPEDKRLCFLINYGFNDYFTGCPMENPADSLDASTYKGGLRTGISKLQAAFPDADFIIMTPTHTSEFDKGMAVTSETGDILPAYIDATAELAREMGLHYIDNYNNYIITQETLDNYVADGTHPNERGRLAIAVTIMHYIQSRMIQPGN